MALQYKKNKINIYVTKEMISQKKKKLNWNISVNS